LEKFAESSLVFDYLRFGCSDQLSREIGNGMESVNILQIAGEKLVAKSQQTRAQGGVNGYNSKKQSRPSPMQQSDHFLRICTLCMQR